MVAGLETLDECGHGGQAGREGQRLLAALDCGQALFERLAIGIAFARVDEAARIFTVGVALEGRGKVDGRRHGASGRIDDAAGVNGFGLEAHIGPV